MYDAFVQQAQERLILHGFPLPKSGADGYEGAETYSALRDFQRAKGIKITSKLDSVTVSILFGDDTPDQPLDYDRDTDEEPADLPDVDLSKNVWPRQKDVPDFYGRPGTNLTRIEPEYDMHLYNHQGSRIKKMTVHQKCAESTSRCLAAVAKTYNAAERKEIGADLYFGTYNPRPMRGGSRPSMHSWAIAHDFDANRNQLKWKKPRARFSHDDCDPWWKIWEAEGWVSLGRARNFDWMHVQAARL